MNKKADFGIGIVLFTVIIILFIVWIVNVSGRECKNDGDCASAQYCGSDFACHDFRIVEKDTIITEINLIGPSIIIGIALIIAAFVLNGKGVRFWKKKEEQKLMHDFSDLEKKR